MTPKSEVHCSADILSTSERGSIRPPQKMRTAATCPSDIVELKQACIHSHPPHICSTGRRMSPTVTVYATRVPKQKTMMFTSTKTPILRPKRCTVRSS
eukprot:scaffold85975_cov62-Phaeocystis_antarctica.AAC.4